MDAPWRYRTKLIQGPPGPPGALGPSGTNGTNGVNASNVWTRHVLASPGSYSPAVLCRVMVNVSGGGAATIPAPDGAPVGAQFGVKITTGPVSATAYVIVTTSGLIEQTVDQAGVPMNMASSATLNNIGDLGEPLVWETDGSNNWVLV